MNQMIARLVKYREIGLQVRHFVFEAPDAETFSFVPGQWVSLTHQIDGIEITRAYSLAAPPCGNRFEISLNLVEHGHFSPLLFGLRPGDAVEMTGPWGDFIFREPVGDSVLVATGTGVVPLRAMLQDRLTKDRTLQFTLLFGARQEQGLLYRPEFEEMERRYPNFRFWPTLSRQPAEWQGRAGRVQAHLAEALGGRSDVDVFVCGLKAMVDDVRGILKAKGFDRRRIRYEKYD